MSFFDSLFNKEKVQCPRCLGKGNVDWDDIKRLQKELRWLPGPCAYCQGKGKISPDLEAKLAVDTTYLTTDLSTDERKKLIAKDEGALQRAAFHEMHTDNFIAEVTYLHFKGNMDSNKIMHFYILHQADMSSEDKEEFLDYINRIIASKKED